jgi:hypothetical protein
MPPREDDDRRVEGEEIAVARRAETLTMMERKAPPARLDVCKEDEYEDGIKEKQRG